jgi:transcription initiation factor TFIIH subunit 2
MASFSHLIRFEANDGKTYYGDLTKETPTREIEGKEVEVLEGDVKSGFSKNGIKAKVSKLLCPLPTTNIILCVGLNYRQHAEECNVSYIAHLPKTHPADLDSSPSPPTQPSS